MIRLAALILALGLSSCTDRQHRNPLDPRTTNPEFFLEPLRVLAGDGRVSLYWYFSEFDDITGFQLYRRIGAGDFSLLTSLDATAVEFEDTKVENAMTYHYQLALLVADEGEILLDRVLSATPGLEVCWVGDLGAATIWRVSPDGRSAQFGRSGFVGLQGIGLDGRDGSLWAISSLFAGLFRIAPDGDPAIREYPAALDEPAALAVAPQAGIVWVVDAATNRVLSGQLEVTADSVRLAVVDAQFREPTALAPTGHVCWIADRLDGRVLRASSVDDGRLEFRDLPEPEAVAAVDTAVVWALASEGTALFRLAAGDPPLEIDLPFVATAIDADPETGQCWVAGAADLAVYSAMGGLIEPQQEFKGGRSMSIRVDAVHRTLWLGGGGRLVKREMDGTTLARLDGFSQSTFLAVDARGGTR